MMRFWKLVQEKGFTMDENPTFDLWRIVASGEVKGFYTINRIIYFSDWMLESRELDDNSDTRSLMSSTSTRISVDYMENLIEKYKCKMVRDSTTKIYPLVWRQFNKFLIRLDSWPKNWEDKTALFNHQL